MQPYRQGIKRYTAQHIPEVEVIWGDAHAVIQWQKRAEIYSNAVFRGGHADGTAVVNYMVPRFFDCSDPVQHMETKCREWGYEPTETVGLITAAKVTHMSVEELEGDECAILCCTSAGTANGARAGLERETYSAYMTLADNLEQKTADVAVKRTPGTINIILVLDACLTESAIFNAMLTVTEAKAAALQDLGITDAELGCAATGTTTDTVTLVIHNSGKYTAEHLYAGTATTIGNAIGKLVYKTVTEAVATQKQEDAELFPTAAAAGEADV